MTALGGKPRYEVRRGEAPPWPDILWDTERDEIVFGLADQQIRAVRRPHVLRIFCLLDRADRTPCEYHLLPDRNARSAEKHCARERLTALERSLLCLKCGSSGRKLSDRRF